MGAVQEMSANKWIGYRIPEGRGKKITMENDSIKKHKRHIKSLNRSQGSACKLNY